MASTVGFNLTTWTSNLFKNSFRTLPSTFDVKDIVVDSRGSPVDEVLLSEQHRKFVEGSDVSVRETDEPFQHRSCQRAHQQHAVHSVRSPCEHHLGVERCEVSLWVFYVDQE